LLHRISPTSRAALAARLRSLASPSSANGADSESPAKIYDFSGSSLDATSQVAPPPPDASAKRFLRYAIQELQPLLLECHAGLPSRGTLAMSIVLHGGPGVGTIVESVDIVPDDSGSTAAFEPSFTECMRETLYAIELPPMQTLDRWDVRYPFFVTASP
jgi:hypothetical protein